MGSGDEANVRFELMLGREAMEAIDRCPVGYLPVGCLERHGDHLPMGLDVIKAHKACQAVARAVGGVVFPPHYYSGIHGMTAEQLARFTGEWGDIFTDASARDSIVDIINQFALTNVRVLVLYSGHYPKCQNDMIDEIAASFDEDDRISVVPFYEPRALKGDHAGISETSLMLYLDGDRVDMSRIAERNYKDHGWTDENTPEKATAAQGEAEVSRIVDHLRGEIEKRLGKDGQ